MNMQMKVLVVRQPWAWLIVKGYKDVENRGWRTQYRGSLLIQASAGLPSKAELKKFRKYALERRVKLPDQFETGGIVGMAQLDNCLAKTGSRWHNRGAIGWKLSKAKDLEFIAMKGRLRLFDPPPSVRKKVLAQLKKS